jgi:four helix bundle protein
VKRRQEIAMSKEPAKSFQDLIVWQKAHQFVLAMYRFTAQFPEQEQNGLATALRRSAVAIGANIAQGFARKSKSDKARFLNSAQTAVDECQYYLLLARDLGYGQSEGLCGQLEEVRRLLGDYTAVILTIKFLSAGFNS